MAEIAPDFHARARLVEVLEQLDALREARNDSIAAGDNEQERQIRDKIAVLEQERDRLWPSRGGDGLNLPDWP